MARIPDEEIQRLKKQISLAELAAARGIALTKSGDNLMGLCPFHDDREPSLVITPESNLWHCLGACQAGGSVIDWVMRSEGISFRHAVEVLRRKGVGAVHTSGPAPKQSRKRKLEPLAEASTADAELMSRVVDHYERVLLESEAGLSYLRARGLEHAELIREFRLGYSDRTLGYKLPSATRKEGEELRARLVELGVYRQSGHEHLSGCLVVPLLDAGGGVVGMYGRRLERSASVKHLYLPGPHRGVFNRQGLGADVIVCEALIDALTFWCAGLGHVTSAYGVEGVTQELLDALSEAGTQRVWIAFDRDEAGDRGAEKLSARLVELGMDTYRVQFPRGMDANTFAQKMTPASKALELVVRQAERMGGERFPSLAASPAPLLSALSPSAPPGEHEDGGGPSSLETLGGLAELGPQAEAETPEPALAPQEASAAPSERSREGADQFFSFGARRWRVRAAGKASATERKVNVLVADESRVGGAFFVDTVELYSARQRSQYAKQAASELDADEAELRRELGAILLELEDEPAESTEPAAETGPEMSDAERHEALDLLRDPRLCERILEDLERAGVVGEETNKLISYVAVTSRKLEEPLAVVIQSSSAAGKSSLMEAVLALMPEEERVQYSAMTGQSLFYMSGQNLKHKVLAIVEEEGAERASYALKLLQSEGELTMASTGKDPATGRLITQTYRVEGPVMIFLTTTSPDVDEELLNRCMVLSVDERRDQTRAIHELQRRAQTLEGVLARQDRRRIRRLHQNAQRLLEPIVVVNPFARELEFADHATRARRDHMKYLTLIRAVTLLFQHQRPVKTAEHRGETLRYIEATREDVELGTRLAQAVLPRGLDDLPPQTRRLLDLVGELVKQRMDRERVRQAEVRFTRREVREWTRWGQTQLRLHLGRLEEHEYVIAHRVGRGSRLAHYELVDLGSGSSSGVEGTSSGVYRGVIGA